MFAFDKKQGFWIVSSVPNFPAPLSKRYHYDDSQLYKAQTIICITLKSEYLGVISKSAIPEFFFLKYKKLVNTSTWEQIVWIEAAVYLFVVFLIITESILKITIPYIYDGGHVEKINPIPSRTHGRFRLKSVGATVFKVFAKSLKFKKGNTYLFNLCSVFH